MRKVFIILILVIALLLIPYPIHINYDISENHSEIMLTLIYVPIIYVVLFFILLFIKGQPSLFQNINIKVLFLPAFFSIYGSLLIFDWLSFNNDETINDIGIFYVIIIFFIDLGLWLLTRKPGASRIRQIIFMTISFIISLFIYAGFFIMYAFSHLPFN